MPENQKINILLIEDNEDDIFFLRKVLADSRYSVKIIKSGKEAYQYLLKPEIKPDVVLLDKMLPGINGFELLEKLKSEDVEYCIIFFTVDDNVNTVIHAMRLGAMDFVIKSANLSEELPEKIEKVYNINRDRVEKQKAIDELKRSEFRFRSLFKNSPIAYFSFDISGRINDVNNKLCNMLGYKTSEMLGKLFINFIAVQHKQYFPKAFEKHKKEGYTSLEIDLTHKSGHNITVIFEGRVEKDPSGWFVKTHCILHNITERKVMENTLTNQFGFQKLVAGISSSFVRVSNDTWDDKINIALEKIGKFYDVDRCYIFSLSNKEKSNNNISIIYEWCEREIEPQIDRLNEYSWDQFPWFKAQMRKNIMIKIDNVEQMPEEASIEKEEFLIQDIKSLLCLPMLKNGDVKGILGLDSVKKQKEWTQKELVQLEVIETTITGAVLRKIAEDALKHSEIRYKTVADYTSNWEYWIDANFNIVYMSPAVEKITGYSAEEFINDPSLLDSIVYKEDVKIWQNHRKEANGSYNDKEYFDLEFRIKCKNGNIVWISHICRRIYTDEGEHLGFRVSNQDITKRVEAERQLLTISSDVEERERSRFAMELHDGLGPLLSNVKLYFQWLAETDDLEKAKLITKKGNQSIDLAIQTTRDISYNLNPPALSKYGYVDAIESIIERINEVHNKIDIDFTFNSKNRFGKVNEKTLYYITSELINNTMKHADAGKIKINFDIKKNENKKMVLFTFEDDGIGFDVENAKNIRENTGVGLWSIFQKVESLRGRIDLNSSPGNGMNAVIQLTI